MQHWGMSDGVLALGADQRAKADASYAARAVASLAMAVTLDSTATRIQQAHVADVLRRGTAAPAHIVNLGHGVPPTTDPGVLTRLVEVVHAAG